MKNASTPFSSARRRFVKAAALLPVAAVATFPAVAAIEPIPRVGGAFLKPGLNAYSFLDQLNANLKDPATGLDLFAVCDFAARQNFDAVDLTGYFFPGYPDAPADAYVNRLKRHVHDLGLVISGTGVRNDFATADKAVRDAGVELTRKWIEVAARLGAPVVRVFAGPQSPHKDWQSAAGNAPRQDVEAWMADALRACAQHGERFGVTVAVQNHGDFVSSGLQHLNLVRRVDHPWCGPLVDTGKYFTDDPYADIAMMAPYAVNWQVKETMGSTVKSPPTDFAKLVNIISASVYRGFLPIETLVMGRKDYDPAREVKLVLAGLRSAIATLK